ncbi:Mu transposase C-terminal domain-containing protein [Oxalobacteraceae bacterium A2-2]
MLLRNDLLQYAPPQARTVRVLWIAHDQSHAYVFDVAAKSAEVELVRMQDLAGDLRSGRARVLPADPYAVLHSTDTLPPKHVELRTRAWGIIEALTRQEPEIYESRRRGQLVADATARHGVSHPTIYRYLRRYWQRGQTPNALLPDYCNSGGRGKVRASSAGVKRGRPRKDGADPGLNADEDIRRVFRVATARYADNHAKFSRQGAYQQMLGDFFCARRIDPDTGRAVLQHDGRPCGPLPTFGQFSYWLDQDDDRPAGVVRRGMARGAGRAAPMMAAMLLPAPCAPAPGRPGDSYYLDVVQAEVLLVSRADRSQTVGRPLVYVAVDSYTRMVTGVHISLERQSWQHALLALAHSGADKVRYGASHGRTIEASQWPSRHLPAAVHVNSALTAGWNGDALLHNFNLRCLPVEQGPNDWRAVLGKRFVLGAPGAAAATSRLDGVLDLEQFTRIVIDAVVYYNNRHQLPGGAIPRQLWDAAVAQGGTSLKPCSEDMLRCCLLPAASAMVTSEGIRLHDSYYTCARAISERWFERARQRGPWSVRLAYDPSDMEQVYLLDAGTPLHFHACRLAERSLQHSGLSLAEIERLPQPAPSGAAANAAAAGAALPAEARRGTPYAGITV